jgi:Flp pilus assembly protein TadD
MAFLTWEQTKTWRDSATLWRHAASCGPERAVARMNYGIHLEQAGRRDEAIELYRDAASRRPGDGRPLFTLANALHKEGDLAGAERAYRESAEHLPQAYMPLVNLGYLLEQQNRPDEALEAFKAAAAAVEPPLRPGSFPTGKPYLALGLALKQRGDADGAKRAFSRALELAIQLRDTETEQQARGRLRELQDLK